MTFTWHGASILQPELQQVHSLNTNLVLGDGDTFIRAIVSVECHYEQTLSTGVVEPIWQPTIFGAIWQPAPFQDVDPGDGLADGGFHWSHWQGVDWVKQITPDPALGSQVTYDAPASGNTFDVQGRRSSDNPITPPGSKLWLVVGSLVSVPPDDPTGVEGRAFWCGFVYRVLIDHA